MQLKNKLFKKIVMLMTVATIMANSGLTTYAQTFSDEGNAAYGWSELAESKSTDVSLLSSEPVWTLREDKDVAVSAGTINLKSYTMTLLNDTKLCKGVTVHSSSFKGYVRARFETVFGEVLEGSDSGRRISYNGWYAETPDNVSSGGWNGVAHTYCGTDI